MLKKSVLDFFSRDLAGVNSSKSYKLLDCSSLAIWQSIQVLPQQVAFQQPAKKGWPGL